MPSAPFAPPGARRRRRGRGDSLRVFYGLRPPPADSTRPPSADIPRPLQGRQDRIGGQDRGISMNNPAPREKRGIFMGVPNIGSASAQSSATSIGLGRPRILRPLPAAICGLARFSGPGGASGPGGFVGWAGDALQGAVDPLDGFDGGGVLARFDAAEMRIVVTDPTPTRRRGRERSVG